MAEKKQESFTVTDRRLFTGEGELRQDVSEEEQASPAKEMESSQAAKIPTDADEMTMPPLPTAAEQQAQADAYKDSAKEIDTRVELSGRSAKELEMTFERFLASLYMTAMLQLGLMHEEGGQPRIDIIGARQTIDTLSLLAEKTRGNLTPAEEGFLQNSLYEVRMAYVEVTNALSRPPSTPAKNVGS